MNFHQTLITLKVLKMIISGIKVIETKSLIMKKIITNYENSIC